MSINSTISNATQNVYKNNNNVSIPCTRTAVRSFLVIIITKHTVNGVIVMSHISIFLWMCLNWFLKFVRYFLSLQRRTGQTASVILPDITRDVDQLLITLGSATKKYLFYSNFTYAWLMIVFVNSSNVPRHRHRDKIPATKNYVNSISQQLSFKHAIKRTQNSVTPDKQTAYGYWFCNIIYILYSSNAEIPKIDAFFCLSLNSYVTIRPF